jgi:hypothetical protein
VTLDEAKKIAEQEGLPINSLEYAINPPGEKLRRLIDAKRRHYAKAKGQ